MSALDDARVVVTYWGKESHQFSVAEMHEALAALVAESDRLREAIADYLGAPSDYGAATRARKKLVEAVRA